MECPKGQPVLTPTMAGQLRASDHDLVDPKETRVGVA